MDLVVLAVSLVVSLIGAVAGLLIAASKYTKEKRKMLESVKKIDGMK